MKEKDDLTNGHLRLVIRLLKYIRDYKNTFHCPSVILTTLLGQRVTTIDAADRYSSVAKTLVHLLEDLVTYLAAHLGMPAIDDPSCPGTSFTHRWDDAAYETFKSQISRYAGWARDALDETDETASVKAWGRLFGGGFTALEVQQLAKTFKEGRTVSLAATASTAAAVRAPGEEFIQEQYPIAISYMARIDAYVIRSSGLQHPRPLRSDWTLPRGRSLRFQVHTDAPAPYKIVWKVRNRGEMATRLGKLRGRLIHGAGSRHTERTQYPGLHYVEAYILIGGRVVAADRVPVNIE